MKFAIIIAIASGVLLISVVILTLVLKPNNSTTTNNPPIIGSSNATSTYQAPPTELKPLPNKAIVQGRLCPQNGSSISPAMITAESIPSRSKSQKFYPGTELAKTDLYYFELDPGTYTFYTESNTREKSATYSQFVTCGMNESLCVSHDLVEVSLEPGDIKTNIDICDYRWQTRFQSDPNSPTVINPTVPSNALPTAAFDPNSL